MEAGVVVDSGADPGWRVRRAAPCDVPAMDAMVRELAAYEREADAVEATPQDLHAALFDADPRVHAHVAEVRDVARSAWEVVGMAVWFTTYSTWTGRHGTWLEDLYVRPQHRGAGLGRALLAALAAEAVDRGHRRLEWAVLDWNTPAQGVYAAVGAQPMQDWTTWRLAGGAMQDLAASRPPASHGPGGRRSMAGTSAEPDAEPDEGADGSEAVSDRVELVVPADPAYLSVLRTATAGLAARLDLTIDEIEDLRIAVDEACALVLGPQALDGSGERHAVEPAGSGAPAGPGAVLSACFDLSPGGLRLEVSGPARTLPGRESFAWAVLEALVSGLETGRDDAGRHCIRLRHDGPQRGG